MYGCDASSVGNGKCEARCQHARTGNDGGDCDTEKRTCASSLKANSKCDASCNNYYNQWDNGKCCDPKITQTKYTCFDPKSPHRAYISAKEYKVALNLTADKHLNVYFAYWTTVGLLGYATFPWMNHVYGVQAGTVLNPNYYGHANSSQHQSHGGTTIHEFGHNLGLWHVFHGTEEVRCGSACFEDKPSPDKGDLCADTAGTPRRTSCKYKPTSEVCGIKSWPGAPVQNFMSYSSDECMSHFTPDQAARMHCYIDLSYTGWRKARGRAAG